MSKAEKPNTTPHPAAACTKVALAEMAGSFNSGVRFMPIIGDNRRIQGGAA